MVRGGRGLLLVCFRVNVKVRMKVSVVKLE